MRKIGDLMKDMGFNKDAPVQTQEAFLRYLLKVTTGVTIEPREKSKKETNVMSKNKSEDSKRIFPSQDYEQLSFNLDDQIDSNNKKAS